MSIKVMSRVWDHSRSHSGERLVLLAIADFADDHGRAFPSVATLATKARLTDRGVQKALQRLVDLGELTIEANAGPHGVNVYQIQLSALVEISEGTSDTPPSAISGLDTPERRSPRTEFTPEQSSPPPRTEFTQTVIEPDGSMSKREKAREALPPQGPVLPQQSPVPAAPSPRPDPMEHLQRPDGWPPVLGLGELDAPVAELYRAFREVRYPGRTGPILPSEIAKDLATLRELHSAGICPEQLAQTTRHALERFSRDRVSLASLARNWSSLTEEPDASPTDTLGAGPAPVRTLRPARRRVTTEEASANVRRTLTDLVTRGDGFDE